MSPVLRHVPAADRAAALAFLAEVEAQAGQLPAAERAALLADLTDHLDEAFAAADGRSVLLGQLLDDLGSPDEIVASAAALSRPAGASPAQDHLTAQQPARPGRRELVYDAIAFAALTVGFFLLPVVGWVAGLALVWLGPRWGTGDKVVASALWPVVVGLPIGCATLLPQAVAEPVALLVLALVLFGWLPYVLVRLWRASALRGVSGSAHRGQPTPDLGPLARTPRRGPVRVPAD